eukprot:jgi/Botrbrau1/23069/Bobra.0243s0010.1
MPRMSVVGVQCAIESQGVRNGLTQAFIRSASRAPPKARPNERCRGGHVPRALAAQKCVPCEADDGALEAMGLCEAFARCEAEGRLAEVPGWQIEEGEKGLLITRRFRTKNFVKALELAMRVGEVGEGEGHHPDLHITSWNHVAVHFTTHARNGLTQNDFICAAKVNSIAMEDLLSKKRAGSAAA